MCKKCIAIGLIACVCTTSLFSHGDKQTHQPHTESPWFPTEAVYYMGQVLSATHSTGTINPIVFKL